MRAIHTLCAAASLFTLALTANAQVTVYTDTTTSAPTFNRPQENLTGPAPAFANSVPYHTYNFTASTSGLYRFASDANYDNFLVLYQNSFNPATPTANALVANDDGPFGIGNSQFNYNVTAGTNYTLVTTGYDNSSFGDFQNNFGLLNTSTFNGTTTGAPTFNRPIAGFPPTRLSGLGTSVPYEAIPFQVSVTGDYDILSTVDPMGAFDAYSFLYDGFFDPNNPLGFASAGNDDFQGDTDRSGFSATLLAGRTYYWVTTGFSNTDFGNYTLTIQGYGSVTAVPEPGVIALLLGVGLSGTLALRRRRK